MLNTKPYSSSPIQSLSNSELENRVKKASKKVSPLWPLERFSAVNPYLGMTYASFNQAAIELATTSGIKSTLPANFYLTKYEQEEIQFQDIVDAFEKMSISLPFKEEKKLISEIKFHTQRSISGEGVATFSDVAGKETHIDWSRFMTDRISHFASGYYDSSQGIWKSKPTHNSLFQKWRFESSIDRTAEIVGLKQFKQIVKSLPNNPLEAIRFALEKLEIPTEALNTYLFRLLSKHNGWAAHVARLDWEKQLASEEATESVHFMAICLCWEACLKMSLTDEQLEEAWQNNLAHIITTAKSDKVSKGLVYALILQEAFDTASQRKLIQKLNQSPNIEAQKRTKVQAIFCIDVRSEIFRRKLEQTFPDIETMGYAGFFGFPVDYTPLGGKEAKPQCPVLLKPSISVTESLGEEKENKEYTSTLLKVKDIKDAWKTFKSSAISCFSFVSPLGLFYLPKLLSDTFGITKPAGEFAKSKEATKGKPEVTPHLVNNGDQAYGIKLEQQVELAQNALKTMSISQQFSDLVLIVGHGANMTNNPHAASYECGACGGHAGDVNAKIAAQVLNDQAVREALKGRDIHIPEATHFIAGLHDTTTDNITLFHEEQVPFIHQQTLKSLKSALAKASEKTRIERFSRFKEVNVTNIQAAINDRSKDWSQVRPEWGLAGCHSFVIAPRNRTKLTNLEGRTFLHTYDWKQDKDFKVLESIMTAPMVVTNWINLQYFGSTVDNKHFGSGNKTLHNITSGIGVLEGNSGDLRVGLPEQAIHDGEKYQHEPQRLSVFIDAPTEAINKVLAKNINIQQLCDNEWLFLYAIGKDGKVSQKYIGDLEWKVL